MIKPWFAMLAGHQGIRAFCLRSRRTGPWKLRMRPWLVLPLPGQAAKPSSSDVVSPFLCLDHFGSSCYPVLPFGSFSTLLYYLQLSPISIFSIYFRYFSLFFQLSSLRYNISTVLLAFVPPWPQVSFPPGLGDVETGKSARNFGDGSGVRFRDKSTFDTSPKFCIDELLWRTDA